jgi:hypothetical protein
MQTDGENFSNATKVSAVRDSNHSNHHPNPPHEIQIITRISGQALFAPVPSPVHAALIFSAKEFCLPQMQTEEGGIFAIKVSAVRDSNHHPNLWASAVCTSSVTSSCRGDLQCEGILFTIQIITQIS